VFLRLSEQKTIEVGALGPIDFKPGVYVYVGSAMNNVEKRIERHFSDVENLHWHIDYFSAEANPAGYFVLPEGSDFECFLADAVTGLGEPVESFGASDCRCNTHLYRIPDL
jgi:Uri superfamily endonuclease